MLLCIVLLFVAQFKFEFPEFKFKLNLFWSSFQKCKTSLSPYLSFQPNPLLLPLSFFFSCSPLPAQIFFSPSFFSFFPARPKTPSTGPASLASPLPRGRLSPPPTGGPHLSGPPSTSRCGHLCVWPRARARRCCVDPPPRWPALRLPCIPSARAPALDPPLRGRSRFGFPVESYPVTPRRDLFRARTPRPDSAPL